MFSTIGNIATTFFNNALASEREKKARQENFALNEKAANNADARTRALYEDYYSPSAQISQLKEAGLSPSLFFGGNGISGSSPQGAQGSGSNGVMPNTYFMDPLTAAQIDNVKADTRKKNAEADTEQGNNTRGMAEIENILANTGKTKAETAFKDLESEWQKLQNLFFSESWEFNIETLKHTAAQVEHAANYMMWQSEREHLQFEFEGETFEKRKELITEQVNNIVQDTATKLAMELLHKSNKEVNDEQKKLIKQNVQYLIDSIELGFANKDINALNATTNKQQQVALEKYQQKMVELYGKQFEINSKDWFDGSTKILGDIIHGAATIGGMFLLKGMKMPMAATPIMWGAGDASYHENYY